MQCSGAKKEIQKLSLSLLFVFEFSDFFFFWDFSSFLIIWISKLKLYVNVFSLRLIKSQNYFCIAIL